MRTTIVLLNFFLLFACNVEDSTVKPKTSSLSSTSGKEPPKEGKKDEVVDPSQKTEVKIKNLGELIQECADQKGTFDEESLECKK